MEWRDGAALSEAEFLAAYRVEDYPRPSVACDMVVFTVGQTQADSYRQLPEQQLQVLLIQRGGHPFLGDWALPGGFVRPGETVGQTAARELREETGLERVYLEQLGVFSDPGRDPRAWVMSCAHMALVRRDQVAPRPGDDARQAAWFSLRCQPGEDGSFRLELEREGGEDRLWATVERPAGDTAGPEAAAWPSTTGGSWPGPSGGSAGRWRPPASPSTCCRSGSPSPSCSRSARRCWAAPC